jgi:hypothetical protein
MAPLLDSAIFENNKFKHCDSGDILIDDMEKNIIPWRNAGGIGILHGNTYNTIQQLKKYYKR